MSTTYKRGDKDDAIEDIQQQLADAGHYDGPIDGDYGPGTEKAVRAFQKANGLVVDGILGPRSQDALSGSQPPSWHMTERDIERAADTLDVDVAAIHAIAEVESNGSGFLSKGRPAILFERHYMKRMLEDRGLNLLVSIASEARPDLVNDSWGGYEGGEAEWKRFKEAGELHPEASPESCSWGRFQIMGAHWENLGYDSVAEFVERMMEDEGEHLKALVRFIEVDPTLHQALKRKEWKVFARIYNGPNYEENNYQHKLADAYQRHSE